MVKFVLKFMVKFMVKIFGANEFLEILEMKILKILEI